MHLILFDDETRDHLLPFTYLKPVCELRLGVLRIREKWAHWFPEAEVSVHAEEAQASTYALRRGEVRSRAGFYVGGEAKEPAIALASIIAKATREEYMGALNRYWAERVAGLRPTAGYPLDAVRFLADLEAAGVSGEVLRGLRRVV